MSCAGQGYIDLEVRRVAGESDEVRLQALRTKKVLDPTETCGECVSDCCEFHSDLFFFSLDCHRD